MEHNRLSTFLDFLLALISCREDNHETISLINYSPQEINQYYKLLGVSNFTVTEDHIEYRICALDAFTKEERQQHTEIVSEYTWELNKDSLLTVWYHRKADSLFFLCLDKYSKQSID